MCSAQPVAMNTVQLCLYDPKHHDALQAFYLPKEQHKYTALPTEVLSKSLEDPNRNPAIILSDETPVGFFVLCTREMLTPYTNNPNAILFYAFSINHLAQRNGYAKNALKELPTFVRTYFPGTNEIILSVHKDNIAAKQLYEKSGFQDLGRRKLGSQGVEIVMHYGNEIKKRLHP